MHCFAIARFTQFRAVNAAVFISQNQTISHVYWFCCSHPNLHHSLSPEPTVSSRKHFVFIFSINFDKASFLILCNLHTCTCMWSWLNPRDTLIQVQMYLRSWPPWGNNYRVRGKGWKMHWRHKGYKKDFFPRCQHWSEKTKSVVVNVKKINTFPGLFLVF